MGLAVAAVHQFASLVWLPTGIALAALLLGGLRLWPGVALGAFLVNAWIGAPIPIALGIALGNTLEAVLGAYLMRRVGGPDWSLERLRDVVALVVLGALLSTVVSATVGVSTLRAAGLVPAGAFGETWTVWWLGDVASDLVVASALLVWFGSRPQPLGTHRRAEAAALALSVIAATALVFLRQPVAAPTGFVRGCLLIPLLSWGAIRLGMRGATAAVVLASAVATTGTALGFGPFVEGSPSGSLLHLQAFMAIVAVAILLLGAVTAERAEALRRATAGEQALRASEERLCQALEALRESDRRKDEFLGVLSHELRNPLHAITTALHVARRVPAEGDAARRARAVIERQTGQLDRLVSDLLDITRITRGKVELRLDPVELGGLVRQAVEDHRPEFEERGVQLTARVEAVPLWLLADAARLTQVVGNLLHNAVKFTSDGGHVDVRVQRSASGEAEIRISDDGIGMEAGMLPHLFEPFTQADGGRHRTRGGLGLGLALARTLVERQGGRIEARSPGLGRGSEFTVSFPVAASVAAPPKPLPPARLARAPRRRVLVIEDNPDAAEMLRETLAMGDHEVLVAHDGEEGLTRARAFRPDVVICDVGLPGLDGYEVARRIRADHALAPALIALTGYALPEDRRRALEAGFDQHLAKPVEAAALEEILARTGTGAGYEGNTSSV
jgi:signal transduction histidine kinase/ActR/RegA family two-component response regulator